MTALPAGPELDRLIAEKVMGWEQDGLGYSIDGGKDYRHPFEPSTNIAHAWEAVECLRKQSKPIIVWAGEVKYVAALLDENAHAFGDHYIDSRLNGAFSASTAPLAICRAALMAVSDRGSN